MDYKKLWSPSKTWSENSQMFEFMQRINEKFNKQFSHYYDLHQWSIDNIPEFWEEFWKWSEIKHSVAPENIVDDLKKMPGATWFSGAKLNFAENLLQRRDDHTAIIFYGEDTVRKSMTYKELFEEVSRIADGLKQMGIKKGDRVAGFVPNMPESIIAMLAAASIGAIWSSIVTRLRDQRCTRPLQPDRTQSDFCCRWLFL